MKKIKYNDTKADLDLINELEKGNFKSVSGVNKEKDRIKKLLRVIFIQKRK